MDIERFHANAKYLDFKTEYIVQVVTAAANSAPKKCHRCDAMGIDLDPYDASSASAVCGLDSNEGLCWHTHKTCGGPV